MGTSAGEYQHSRLDTVQAGRKWDVWDFRLRFYQNYKSLIILYLIEFPALQKSFRRNNCLFIAQRAKFTFRHSVPLL